MYKSAYLFSFLFLVSTLLFAQKVNGQNHSSAFTYSGQWHKIDSLKNKGLYNLALDEVELLLKNAVEEKNHNQIIKGVLFELKFNQLLKEDDYVLGIKTIEELIGTAPSPSKEILHSILAEVYYGLYNANSYSIDQRTELTGQPDDIKTWGKDQFMLKIVQNYIASIKNQTQLKQFDISDFTPILKGLSKENQEKYPTVFDFLANRAYRFFKNESFDFPFVGESFSLNDPAYFYSNEQFLKFNKATKDSLNSQFIATKILWTLTRFQTTAEYDEPLFYTTMERLKFALNKSTLPQKEKLYEEGLQRLAVSNKGEDYAAVAWYELAEFYRRKGNKYRPDQDTTTRWYLKQAVDLCENTMEEYPNTNGAQSCKALAAEIKSKSMNARIQEGISANRENLFLLNYKNVDAVHYKIIKTTPEDFSSYAGSNKLVGYLQTEKGIEEEKVILKNPGDYQDHATELLLPKLDYGMYVLVLSSDESYSNNKEGFAFTAFWVTDLTYQQRRDGNNEELIVTNRETGEPVADVKVTVYKRKYSYSNSNYKKTKVGTFTTDKSGYTKTVRGKREYYVIELQKGKDHYQPNNAYYHYQSYNSTDKQIKTQFYTDRKIYRPGQKIYFKGLVVSYDNLKERSLKKNYSTTVIFKDQNRQEIARKEVKTNEFGSFHGEFTAPYGTLTGTMSIVEKNGSTSFNVEEYKRPKFTVDIDPLEGEYELKDEVKVTGKAMAYAGNPIDGAKVEYVVNRSVQYPNYWYWWQPRVAATQVKTGTVKTNDEGVFEIPFTAIPDPTKDPKSLPVFVYEVIAKVTDINGETHEVTSSVQMGYQSLMLGNNIENEVNGKTNFVLKVNTTNLNGQPISVEGNFKIEQLQKPETAFVDRIWNAPDMPTLTKKEYQQKFPYLPFGDENLRENWAVEKVVTKQNFNAQNKDSIAVEVKDWKPGVYKYTATAKDKNGIEVTDIKYFTVFDPESNVASTEEILWVKPSLTKAEPGDDLKFWIASGAENVHVRYDLEANGSVVDSKIITLNKEQKVLDIAVKEAYRGNITAHFSVIKHNHLFSKSVTVQVPYTNKELALEFAAFRNKLLPGSNETWELTIKNKNGGYEEAELLATLYDASLDQLNTPNSFFTSFYRTFYGKMSFGNAEGMQTNTASNRSNNWNERYAYPSEDQLTLNTFGWSPRYYHFNRGRMLGYFSNAAQDSMVLEEAEANLLDNFNVQQGSGNGVAADMAVSDDEYKTKKEENNLREDQDKTGTADLGTVKARTNFNETAFFYPQLTTDKNGTVKIKFTIPEALTKWRFLGMAHTKDLKVGSITEETVTQKDLMVSPNMPRFLREGDQMVLVTKISNISAQDLSGAAQLVLIDPFTEKEIGEAFRLTNNQQAFEAKHGKSTTVSWKITIPDTISTVKVKIVAKAGNFSDGEEHVLPILSNRKLVTEAMPLPIRGNETKTFSFDKLVNSTTGSTLKNHRYTLEFTSNPAWYAVQAMPYMMEYPHECAEQIFTRYYSNAIATHIMKTNPKIEEVVEKWGEKSPEAFLSNLQKNQELKAVILEETPWVLAAKSEEESKRNLAVLLDMERMSKELDKALSKIKKAQTPNGGWPWFKGMPENRFITQHIITGMGHLDHLGVSNVQADGEVWEMVQKGVYYMDMELLSEFKRLKERDKDYLKEQHLWYTQIQYLYARSFFTQIPINKELEEAVKYYKNQAAKYWLKYNLQGQAMIGLAAHRFNTFYPEQEMQTLASDIVKSLKDRAIQNEEMGMYWKDYTSGIYWYEAPVETQALMIELFNEVAKDETVVDELKIWLLKQKQTTNWKTTKQTTEAVYALLVTGSDLLASDELVEITIGNQPIKVSENPDENNPYEVSVEVGTGYIKTHWAANEIKPEMGAVTVTKNSKGVAWGAVYWQYFEDLDKITGAQTNLSIEKELYRLAYSNGGEQLEEVSDNSSIKIGDKVRVRMVLRTDRNLEYVHLKDMRAAGFEPVDVLSRYHYKNGLGYYQSTRDAATDFFFDYIPKGTYVFEYDLTAQHQGDFSNGIATIQCMYAPEFVAHTDGISVSVKK